MREKKEELVGNNADFIQTFQYLICDGAALTVAMTWITKKTKELWGLQEHRVWGVQFPVCPAQRGTGEEVSSTHTSRVYVWEARQIHTHCMQRHPCVSARYFRNLHILKTHFNWLDDGLMEDLTISKVTSRLIQMSSPWPTHFLV